MGRRAAGTLLAVSSLHSPRGIGGFGESAVEWLRFLRDAGQKYWQILPLGPTGWGDSPYQSFSAFAISPYYICLDDLVRRGLLSLGEARASGWGRGAASTDYGALYKKREPLLRLACARFSASANVKSAGAFEGFHEENAFWLEDYALFMAIKKKLRGKAWSEWDADLRRREPAAMKAARDKLSEEAQYYALTQHFAFDQWRGLRDAARSLGVAIIGDMPMYVAADSADGQDLAPHELYDNSIPGAEPIFSPIAAGASRQRAHLPQAKGARHQGSVPGTLASPLTACKVRLTSSGYGAMMLIATGSALPCAGHPAPVPGTEGGHPCVSPLASP